MGRINLKDRSPFLSCGKSILNPPAMDPEDLMQLLKSYKQARNEGVAPRNSELESLLDALNGEEDSEIGLKLPGSSDSSEATESVAITPQPFFCVKTKNSKEQKVFINICASNKIPAPENWDHGIPPEVEEALESINSDKESVENLRVPLSCADPENSTDNNGKPCLVFDVVFSQSVLLLAAERSNRLKVFLISMALTWIGQKYDSPLNSEFRLLHIKYKGKAVRAHYIRAGPKAPLVTEIPDSQPSFPLLPSGGDTSSCVARAAQFECDTKLPMHSPNKCDMMAVNSFAATVIEQNTSLEEVQVQSPKFEATFIENNVEYEQKHQKACSPDAQHGDGYMNATPQQKAKSVETEQGKGITNEQMRLLKQQDKEDSMSLFKTEASSRHDSYGDGCVLKCEELTLQGNGTYAHARLPGNKDESIGASQIKRILNNPMKPLIKTVYEGHPVEYTVVHMTFPIAVEVKDLVVLASHSEVCVETGSFDPIQLHLLFPALPSQIQVVFSENERLLAIRIPYLSYIELQLQGSKVENCVKTLEGFTNL